LPIHRIGTAPPVVAAACGAQAAPLSAAAVASLAVARPPEPQVIEVTIDRIDIRAPAAERPKHDTSKPRPKPMVELADYLRNGGGRR
jgi:hypothetical protein